MTTEYGAPQPYESGNIGIKREYSLHILSPDTDRKKID